MNDIDETLCYRFDGSLDGLMCCLFECFTNKETPFLVTSGSVQLSFGLNVKSISTDKPISERVKQGIIKCGAITLLNAISYVMRSSDSLKENIIFEFARRCLKERKNLSTNFADSAVAAFCDLKSRIGYEVHRLLGFMRFEQTARGIWYAHFEPDNDIVDILAPHFQQRFPKEKFILHDVKRNRLAIWDFENLYCFTSDKPVTVFLSDEENGFKSLWKTYYDTVAIPSRKNTRLMKAYMPVRYHKHLPEKAVSKVFGEKVSFKF